MTGELKLTILYDNTATEPSLASGWGFAALIEQGGHTLLFDTGESGQFLLDNMEELGVDPASIEAVILSHEHEDHTNGLWALLDKGFHPTVYAPAAFAGYLQEASARSNGAGRSDRCTDDLSRRSRDPTGG